MATFTIEWMERKTTSTGKPMIKTSLKDAQGAMQEDVAIWGDFPNFAALGPGTTVEGDVVSKQNGQYVNKTLYPARQPAAPRGGGAGMKAAQERKAEMIKEAQERKSESVAYFNSINVAIQFITAFRNEMDLQNADDIFGAVLMYRDKLLKEWQEYEKGDYQNKHQAF